MIKVLKFFQYAYLIIAVILCWEGISKWNDDREMSYILLFFSALAVFIFFFRKHFRKKFEQQRRNQ